MSFYSTNLLRAHVYAWIQNMSLGLYKQCFMCVFVNIYVLIVGVNTCLSVWICYLPTTFNIWIWIFLFVCLLCVCICHTVFIMQVDACFVLSEYIYRSFLVFWSVCVVSISLWMYVSLELCVCIYLCRSQSVCQSASADIHVYAFISLISFISPSPYGTGIIGTFDYFHFSLE